MFARKLFGSCLALVMVFAACSSDGPSYVPCPNGDSDCPANATCIDGECRPADVCSEDADCEGDRVCIDGYCRMPECTEDADCPDLYHCTDHVCVEGECRTDEDCADDHYCSDSYECVADECITDGDCAADEYCNEGRCEDRPIVDCTTDDECREDELCLDGTCQVPPDCSEDGDCPEGTVCEGGNCIRACVEDSDCDTGGMIPYECRDGHCLQQCVSDNTCQGDKICEDGVCVDPECQGDEDCTGEYVRCIGGRCEEYEPCETTEDCSDPNYICIDGICEELPTCAIDQDCADEEMCQEQTCVCEDGHCHTAATCETDDDCDPDFDCVGGICVAFVCRGPEDCEVDEVCVGGECISAGDPDYVTEVVITTPGGPIQPDQVIELQAIALTVNGQEVPGIGFDWESSEPDRAAVDVDGVLTGGTEAGETLVTATAQGTSPAVESDPVIFTNVQDPAENTIRITVVNKTDRTPVEGATIWLQTSDSSEEQQSATDGTVSFTDPEEAVDIHVFHADYDYVSVFSTSSKNMLVPLPLRSQPTKAGGFTGEMTFTGEGEVSLGLAGCSIGGSLVDLNFGRLLGEIFNVTVEIPGAGNFDLSLPSQIVLAVTFQGYPFDIKPVYYVNGERGMRTAWGMGGKLGFNTLQDIMGSGGSVAEILVGLLPYFELFDHGLQPNIDIFPIPMVADTNDIDGDSDTAEMRPDWDGFDDHNLAPSQEQNLSVYVETPDLPMHLDGRIRTAVFLGGALTSHGLTPLGITSETADTNGQVEPVMMKMAPAYGGLQSGKYMLVVLAIPSGDAVNLPTNVAMVVHTSQNLPADLTFASPFLEFPDEPSYSTIERHMVAAGVAGSTLFRSTIKGDDGVWEIYLPNADEVSYTLPDPPDGMDDLALGDIRTLDPIALGDGMTFDDLVTFNGSDLDVINALMTACSRFEL